MPPLITPTNVRQHTPQIKGDAEDPLFTTAVGRVDALMAAWCGWMRTTAGIYTMVSATYEVWPRPRLEEPKALDLDFRWILDSPAPRAWIDSLWIYGDSTEVAAADLLIDNDEGALWLMPGAQSSWSKRRRDNKVTFTGGFETTPEDLIAACAFGVRHLLGRGRTGGNQSTRAGESITPSDADMLLPKATKEALAPYVRWSTRVG